VPDTVSDHAAALCEPLASMCRCLLDPARVNAGDHVLVMGPGAMGLLSAQVARAQGATVVLSGLPSDELRLAVARELGIDTATQQAADESYDVVIECSGSAGGAASALRASKRGGRYVAVGIFGKPIVVDLDAVLYKELTLTSGFASTPQSWRRAIALLRNRQVALEPLVGRIAALTNRMGVGFRGSERRARAEERFRPLSPDPAPHPRAIIGEYARHNGHADLLRAIDGRKGSAAGSKTGTACPGRSCRPGWRSCSPIRIRSGPSAR
jgi:L-iditol 2-dehydrogenase